MADREWRGGSQLPHRGWLVALGVLLAVGGAWLVLAVPDKDGSSVSPVWVLVPVIAGAVVVAASIVFTSVAVVLDAAGVHMRFGPWGRPGRDIPWASVEGVVAVDVRALPWGGWGYRWNPWKKGTAAVMRRGPGLQFDLSDGRMLVVTVDDAEAGATAARQWCRPASGS